MCDGEPDCPDGQDESVESGCGMYNSLDVHRVTANVEPRGIEITYFVTSHPCGQAFYYKYLKQSL